MEKHKEYTPGKLLLDEQNDIVSADGWGVVAAQITYNLFKGNPLENKRRIVACWNACEGIETEILQALPLNFKQFERIQTQNARLLDALETALAHGIQTREGRDIVRFAIAEAERKE